MALKNINDADLTGKRVLARFDFNVPLDKTDYKKILDTSRIDLALPTIKQILSSGAKHLVMMSHLGRPKGEKNEAMSLEPVAAYIAEQIGREVTFTESAVDAGLKEFLNLPAKGIKIVLLENLRFHKEETANEEMFAQKLSEYADVYINDAFGAAHRKHASTYSINKFFKGNNYAGLLMIKEIEALNTILNSPKKPFIAVVGGAKVADKIKTLEKLLVSVDKLIIGGAMAYPFLKAQGHEIGNSLCSDEDVKLAQMILRADSSGKITLPLDHIVSSEFGGTPTGVNSIAIKDSMMGLDIGPNTITKYTDILKTAKTVLWNGPMGTFENTDYAKGTMALCETIATLDAFTLVGGGDSVAAVQKFGLADKFSHVSTGGGASLEYIEKSELPGIQALKFGVN